jgi:hypothetical protein
MAVNKVKMASERAKMKLQSDILSSRARIEEMKQNLATKRKNLNELRAATKRK